MKKFKSDKEINKAFMDIWNKGESPDKILKDLIKDKVHIIKKVGGSTSNDGRYYKVKKDGEIEFMYELKDFRNRK